MTYIADYLNALPNGAEKTEVIAALKAILGLTSIEDLPAASSVSGTEKIPALQGVNPVYLTPAQIAALGGGSLYPAGLSAPASEEYFWKLGKGIDANAPTNVLAESLSSYTQVGATIGRLNTTTETIRLLLNSTSGNAIAQLSGRALRVRSAAGQEFRFKAKVAFTTPPPSSAVEYWASIGFIPNDGLKESTDFLIFQYHHNGTSAVFEARRRINNGTIASTTLTFPGAGVFTVLEVVVTQTEIRFYQDGVLVVTDTTNLPTTGLRESAGIARTSGTTNAGLDVRWMAAKATGLVS